MVLVGTGSRIKSYPVVVTRHESVALATRKNYWYYLELRRGLCMPFIPMGLDDVRMEPPEVAEVMAAAEAGRRRRRRQRRQRRRRRRRNPERRGRADAAAAARAAAATAHEAALDKELSADAGWERWRSSSGPRKSYRSIH